MTRLGLPVEGLWQYPAFSGGTLAAVAGGVRALDPSYVTDFWTKPGYEGSDPSVRAARIQHDATVAGIVGNPPIGVVLSGITPNVSLLAAIAFDRWLSLRVARSLTSAEGAHRDA